jgi:hypothetical protein
MLPDLRLDFINNIENDYIEIMTELRLKFIALDDNLREISNSSNSNRDGVGRCLSLARTNIEIALQYSIKALCLMGEIKK